MLYTDIRDLRNELGKLNECLENDFYRFDDIHFNSFYTRRYVKGVIETVYTFNWVFCFVQSLSVLRNNHKPYYTRTMMFGVLLKVYSFYVPSIHTVLHT